MFKDFSHRGGRSMSACKTCFDQHSERIRNVVKRLNEQPRCGQSNSGLTEHDDPDHQALPCNSREAFPDRSRLPLQQHAGKNDGD